MALECFKILYNMSPPRLNDLVVLENSKYSFRYSNIVEMVFYIFSFFFPRLACGPPKLVGPGGPPRLTSPRSGPDSGYTNPCRKLSKNYTGNSNREFPIRKCHFPQCTAHIPLVLKMANVAPDYDQAGDDGCTKVKVICLGDSAVGKSK